MIVGMTQLDELLDLVSRAEVHLSAGRSEQAEQLCERALAMQPDLAKALMLLSVVHIIQSNFAAAEALLLRGCGAHPQQVAFHAALAQFRLQSQRLGEALEPLENCVILDPGARDHRIALLNVYQTRLFNAFSERSKRALLACLKDDTLSHWLLHRQWLSLLRFDPESAPILELFGVAEYATFSARISLELLTAWQANEFLNAGLQRFLVADLQIERGLGFTRRWFLEHPAEAEAYLPLLCTLARYCFLAEYVLPVHESRAQQEASVTTAAQAALLGCYEALFLHAQRETLAELSDLPSYRQLIAIQVSEPLQEHALRAQITRLNPITDRVSLAVRDQYEENPYPRWSSVGGSARSNPALQAQARGRRILIAGCGTGREAVETALTFPEATVEAIDLSLASLSYGVRKARQLGTSNLRFQQADLLELAGLGAAFDWIVCAGVLHHLEDPGRGLRALVARLARGGVLRVALYSTIGRRAITAARAWAARAGFAGNRAGIQQFRAAVAELEDGDPIRSALATSYDFYSLSQCRDLLFHVQEHTFTCLEVAELLRACELAVVRVDTKSPRHHQAYRHRFPEDPRALTLANWHQLELEQPTLFAGLYSFWLCRARELASVELGWIENTRHFS